jgi:hypothetical protein
MQQAKGGVIQPGSASRDHKYRTVVSDLASVIEQVRNSLRLIESEIASEAPYVESAADNVFVLDDVTPGYTRAWAVLRECDAGLSAALHLLQESGTPGYSHA